MLDSNARKVLKYFIKANSVQSWDIIAYNLNMTSEKDIALIEIAIEDLLETNCIKCLKDDEKSYKLTSFGKTYFKNQFFNVWFPIFTASVSLLISLLAK